MYARVLKSLHVWVSATAVDIDTDASLSVYLFSVLHVRQFSLFIYSAIPISVCPLHSCSLCRGWLFLVSVMFYYACASSLYHKNPRKRQTLFIRLTECSAWDMLI